MVMKTECQKPTKKYPNGRTGTQAGIGAHSRVKEKNCEACAELKREYDRLYREKNKDKKREYARLYYEKNAEVICAKSRKWHHENKEKSNAYKREYRKNNPERVRAAIIKWHEENAEYREENRDKMREAKRAWRKANPEKWEGYSRKRRALIASQPHEAYTREDVAELHGTVCYLCGGEVDMSLAWGNDRSPAMDHLWPLNVPGGTGDVLSNMWVTHSVCNIRKGDRMVETLTLPFAEPESRAWDYANLEESL